MNVESDGEGGGRGGEEKPEQSKSEKIESESAGRKRVSCKERGIGRKEETYLEAGESEESKKVKVKRGRERRLRATSSEFQGIVEYKSTNLTELNLLLSLPLSPSPIDIMDRQAPA